MRVDLHSRVHDLLRPNQTSTPTPPRPSGTLLPANLLRRTTFTLAFVYLCGSLSESTGCATAVRRAFWERGGFFRALELSLRQRAETDPEAELRCVVVVVVVLLSDQLTSLQRWARLGFGGLCFIDIRLRSLSSSSTMQTNLRSGACTTYARITTACAPTTARRSSPSLKVSPSHSSQILFNVYPIIQMSLRGLNRSHYLTPLHP